MFISKQRIEIYLSLKVNFYGFYFGFKGLKRIINEKPPVHLSAIIQNERENFIS